MRRRVFISYEHPEQLGPAGFDPGAYRDLHFRGRHLSDPASRDDPSYIKGQLARSAVTLVLIGPHTAEDRWVANEIEWTLERGNGLVGVLLDPAASPPDRLHDAGAEILDWSDSADVAHLKPALRAAAGSAALLRRAAQRGTGSGESCARPTARFPD
jgi:hypothetical protein